MPMLPATTAPAPTRPAARRSAAARLSRWAGRCGIAVGLAAAVGFAPLPPRTLVQEAAASPAYFRTVPDASCDREAVALVSTVVVAGRRRTGGPMEASKVSAEDVELEYVSAVRRPRTTAHTRCRLGQRYPTGRLLAQVGEPHPYRDNAA